MKSLTIVICGLAEAEHERSLRQYAHVFHVKGVICVASAFWRLPGDHILGLLAHEVGHVLAKEAGLASTEDEADAAAGELGIAIRYKDGPHGRRLQYLTPTAQACFHDVLFLNGRRVTLGPRRSHRMP